MTTHRVRITATGRTMTEVEADAVRQVAAYIGDDPDATTTATEIVASADMTVQPVNFRAPVDTGGAPTYTASFEAVINPPPEPTPDPPAEDPPAEPFQETP